MSAAPDVRERLRDVIVRALDADYSGVSPHDGIVTGNHYQSILLADERTAGFRSDRAELLDRLDFAGRKVLDLGSNLGELSRAARARGAELVDGFEHDPYFVRLANLINAYNGATRVSFYERDIGDPRVYEQRYDIVLAFAVWTYVHGCISRIAELADVLVLETHRLHGNLERQYIDPVSAHFPFHRVLGETEWAMGGTEREVRAVVVFAKEPSMLGSVLRPPAAHTGAGPGPARAAHASVPGAEVGLVDMERTCLQRRFFEHFRFDCPEDLLAAVDGFDVDLGALVRSHDARSLVYSGWVYWMLFVKGYLQYEEAGDVAAGNVFLDYLTGFYGAAAERGGDPELRVMLADEAEAAVVVRRRFEDLRRFRHGRAEEVAEQLAPIRIHVGEQPDGSAHDVFEVGRTTPLRARGVDGWHRLFAAKLFGAPALRAEVVQGRAEAPIRGRIEEMRVDGTRLHLRGWCAHAESGIGSVEVRARGKGELVVAPLHERPDVRASFAHMPQTLLSGFDLGCAFEPGEELQRIDVVALREWVPMGTMTAYHRPGMFDALPLPPAALAQRLAGESGPYALGTRSLKVLHELLGPVGRFRDLATFRAVLDWGCGCGLLELYAGEMLPNARLTGVEFDREAVDWCRSALPGEFVHCDAEPAGELPAGSADLVLGYAVLPRLGRQGQRAWLADLARATAHGAYAAFTVRGELERPFVGDPEIRRQLEGSGIWDGAPADGVSGPAEGGTLETREYTVGLCSEWFDVLAYAEGAVDDQQDLIVLRKP